MPFATSSEMRVAPVVSNLTIFKVESEGQLIRAQSKLGDFERVEQSLEETVWAIFLKVLVSKSNSYDLN